MTVDIKKTDAEELSFLDIVRRDGNIKIPLIQRDYAQGRPSKKITSIREKFIKDIYNCIINKTRLNLDFVYGATNGKDLYLLMANSVSRLYFSYTFTCMGLRGEQNEKLNFFFTYETRDSSRLFCEKIIANRYELFSVESLSSKKDSGTDEVKPMPSSIIRDQSWC